MRAATVPAAAAAAARRAARKLGLVGAAAIVSLALTCVMGARGQGLDFGTPTITGDQGAWEEVKAATMRQNGTSYRSKASNGDTGEYSHGSSHTFEPYHEGVKETVTVGGETRFRLRTAGGPGVWLCNPPAQGDSSLGPLKQALASIHESVDVSRGADAMIDGTPVHSYTLHITLQASTGAVSSDLIAYIGAQNGLPLRWVTPDSFGSTAPPIVTDYYDYGAPIRITLPACGTS